MKPRWMPAAQTRTFPKPRGRVARRPPLPFAALAAGFFSSLLWVNAAHAFERIGVVAPLGDRHAILGQQVVEGAREALGLPENAITVLESAPSTATETPGNGLTDDTIGLEDSPDPVPERPEPPSPWGVELVAISDPCRGGDNAGEDGALVASRILEADQIGRAHV